MLRMQSVCQQDADVYGLEDRLCQRDAELKNMQRQVIAMAVHLNEAK